MLRADTEEDVKILLRFKPFIDASRRLRSNFQNPTTLDSVYDDSMLLYEDESVSMQYVTALAQSKVK